MTTLNTAGRIVPEVVVASRSAAILEARDFINGQPNERIVKLDKSRLVLVVREGFGVVAKIRYMGITLLPDFDGSLARIGFDREAGEYVVLVDGRPVAWYGRGGYQDAYRHAAEVNYRDAELAALEQRAAVADGVAALAESRAA